MKLIENGQYKTVQSAWGRDIRSKMDIYEVEKSDVGTVRKNYRGYQYAEYEFTYADVGRQIAVYFYEGWTSWVFHTTANSQP